MLTNEIKKDLDLYVNHKVSVRVAEESQSEIRGELLSVEEGALLIELEEGQQNRVLLDEIEDVRYVGQMTDYHANDFSGEIDKSYKFGLDDCLSEEKEELRYHEREYKINCHLTLEYNTEDALGCIVAKDVILEENPIYVLNTEILCEDDFLYTFRNGDVKVGKLEVSGEDCVLFYNGTQCYSFAREELLSVTKCPQINDKVSVQMEQAEVAGLVTAVKENGFNVYTADKVLVWVAFSNVNELRYQGKIVEYTPSYGKRQFFVDSKYWTKEAYLKDWNQNKKKIVLAKGMVTSYAVSVNARGMIARDLVIEQGLEHSRTGIILTMDQNGDGWIGSHYITNPKARTEKENGNVCFRKDDLPKDMVYEPMKYIYIVKYSSEPKPDTNGKYRLLSMELVERLDYASTGAVHLDVNGKVEVIPFFRTNLEEYMDKEVSVQLKSVQRAIVGRMLSVDETKNECTLEYREDVDKKTQIISLSEVETIRIIGEVTAYYDNGFGYIDQKYYFNIKNIKNGTQYSDLKGKRVSFVLQNSNRESGKTDSVDLEVLEEVKTKTAQIIGQEHLVIIGDAGENGYEVVEAEKYETYVKDDSYILELTGKKLSVPANFDTLKYDYPITERTIRRDGKLETEILFGEPKLKRRFGYLNKVLTNNRGVKYTYVCPSSEEEKGLYCNVSSEVFDVESLEKYSLNTQKQKYYYLVAYTLSGEGNKQQVQYVKVLAEKARINYKYGFIPKYVRTDETTYMATIFEKYYPRANREVNEEDDSKPLESVEWSKVQWKEGIEPVRNLNLNNFVYFVKYEKIKDNIRIHYIEKKRKPILSAYQEEGNPVWVMETFSEPAGAVEKALEMIAGENVLIDNQVYQYVNETEDAFVFKASSYGVSLEETSEIEVEKGSKEVYRIGVLTAVDDEFKYAYINDYLKFPTERMNGKTYNIYRNERRKLAVLYSEEPDGTVKEVILPESATKNLFYWKKCYVKECGDRKDKNRKAIVQCEEKNIQAEYFFSLATDSAVSGLGNGLKDKDVYAHIAKCSAGKNEEYNNKWIAFDLRLERETMYVNHDESGRYCVRRGERDLTNVFPVMMGKVYDIYWKENEEKKVEVIFNPHKEATESVEMLYAYPRDIKYENPYEEAANGHVLTVSDGIFKGRVNEKKDIWNYIIKDNEVQKGRIVLLHGQKRCGKSSLVSMIQYDITQVDGIKDNTIVVNVVATNTEYYELEEKLCSDILLTIQATIVERMKNIDDEKEKAEYTSLFNEIEEIVDEFSMSEFSKFMKGFYVQFPNDKVILIVDEFTTVCVKLLREWKKTNNLEEKEMLEKYLSIIMELSVLGVTQIIIGHANMMSALYTLGKGNEIIDKSMDKPLNVFSTDDAKALILEPMKKVFGKEKFYSEEDDSIGYLMDISGRSPYVLMNFCSELFKKYKEDRGSLISKKEIDEVANEFCRKSLYKKFLGIILVDVGDDENENIITKEEEPINVFLNAMVMAAGEDGRYCAKKDLAECLQARDKKQWTNEEINLMLETQKDREVIEEKTGEYYRITMGFYYHYTHFKAGDN